MCPVGRRAAGWPLVPREDDSAGHRLYRPLSGKCREEGGELPRRPVPGWWPPRLQRDALRARERERGLKGGPASAGGGREEGHKELPSGKRGFDFRLRADAAPR